jgi:hypothetical protein
MGSAVGSNQAAASSYSLQAAFDAAYAQCMVTKGDHVPQGVGTAPYGYPGAVAVAPGYAYPGPAVVVAPAYGYRYGYGWGYRRW